MATLRADLQGFRGFAVILILLFTSFPHIFKNGSFGVDTFLILSGYLCQMQYSEKSTTSMGLMIYIRNRLFRLFPLYLMVLFGILAFGCVFLPSNYAEDELNDSKWAIFMASNLKGVFTNKGFFMQDFSFLHHTWIIALQFQFFALAPLIFFQLSKCKTLESKITSLLVPTFCSFAVHMTTSGPTSLESIISRFWQFQIGAISYLATPSRNLLDKEKKNDVFACEETRLIGKKWREEVRTAYVMLAVILATITVVPDSFMVLKTDTLIRISATGITAVLFAFGPSVSGSKVEKIFGNQFLVILGNHAFVLYLVFWPIMEAFRCANGGLELGFYQNLQVVLATLFVAIPLHLVETLFKSSKFFASVFLGLSFTLITMLIMSLSHDPNTENLSYYGKPPNAQKPLEKTEFYWSSTEVYFDRNWNYNQIVANAIRKNSEWICSPNIDRLPNCTFEDSYKSCEIESGAGKLTIAFIGDDFPAAYEAVKRDFKHIYVFSVHKCDILWTENNGDNGKCGEKAKEIYTRVEAVKPDVIFLLSRYVDATARNHNENSETLIINNIKRLSAFTKHIIITRPFPSLNYDAPSVLLAALQRTTHINNSYKQMVDSNVEKRLKHIKDRCVNCTFIDQESSICRNGDCFLYDKGSLLSYFANEDRLSFKGHELMYDQVKAVFNDVKKKIL
ncbi:hypothetical protein L596_015736 [Steinernema carpocapsae]|uniref:SGNH domain-containing protein n=1 Tax=Steinernema carpocapsae TaxID=34508 RepID=A0A4U5NGY1_STECR|nr:hypothetical protein L596_015736 [Steinernema carpocapsae]